MKPLCAPTTQEFSELSDAELMSQVTQGSQPALETLYARHTPLLRSIIHQVMNNYAEVDEVLQDLFLFVWRNGSSYSPERGQPLGWLITIARRRAFDRVRRRSAYQHATDRFQATCHYRDDTQPAAWIVDDDVRQHELQSLVDHSLQLLPPHQREAVTLAFLKGLSQREIAAQLSVPLGTVKTRVELGMRKLSRSGLLQHAA